MPGGWGEVGWGIGPWGYTDFGVYSLFKQIPRFYLDTDATIAGQPFKNFLLSVAPLIRSSREFSDRFPLLVDAQAVRPELLVTLGDNVGAFATNDDADIIKRNQILNAYTWFTTKQLKNAYIAIARMNGLDALVEELYEIGEDSGIFTTTPPREFQFAPGIAPNVGVFPQDAVAALPGTTPVPFPNTDFVDAFFGVGPPDPAFWQTITAGGTAIKAVGLLTIAAPAVADVALVVLLDRYDRRAKFDTIFDLVGIPGVQSANTETAYIAAILQAPSSGTFAGVLAPKPQASALGDRRVTAEADINNGVFYLRVVLNDGTSMFWDQVNQKWVTGKVGVSPFTVPNEPYRFILRTHSQWFKWIVLNNVGAVIADTKPFFWEDVLNNGMPMKVAMGDPSSDAVSFDTLVYTRFESAFTEDNDYGKLSCLQIQFFIPPPGSGAGTFFPPFSGVLDATALAVILANIRSKFQKVTPIHIRIKYPTIELAAPAAARFFQHFDVNDLVESSPVTLADLAANPNVDAAFTDADAHPADASPGDPFTKPPWVAGVGVGPVLYKEGQDGGWVESIQVLP